MSDSQTSVAYDELLALVTDIFAGCGVPEADARHVAECLIDADTAA